MMLTLHPHPFITMIFSGSMSAPWHSQSALGLFRSLCRIPIIMETMAPLSSLQRNLVHAKRNLLFNLLGRSLKTEAGSALSIHFLSFTKLMKMEHLLLYIALNKHEAPKTQSGRNSPYRCGHFVVVTLIAILRLFAIASRLMEVTSTLAPFTPQRGRSLKGPAQETLTGSLMKKERYECMLLIELCHSLLIYSSDIFMQIKINDPVTYI